MDDGYERPQRSGPDGRGADSGVRSRPNSGPGKQPGRGEGKQTGGLLSRYGARQDAPQEEQNAPPAWTPNAVPSSAPRYVPGGKQEAPRGSQTYVPGGQSSGSGDSLAGRYVPGTGESGGATSGAQQGDGHREPWSTPLNDRLRSRDEPNHARGARGAWQALTGQARRLGANIRHPGGESRAPRAGEWRATDFDPEELEDWDQKDSAPFEVPVNSEDEPDFAYTAARRMRNSQLRNEPPSRGSGARSGPRGAGAGGWSDEQWDRGWETGTWDTGWATNQQQSMEYGRAGSYEDGDSGFWAPGRGGDGFRAGGEYGEHEGALDASLNTLAQLGAVGVPLGRLARVRLLLRRRPAAAAMLAFFLLGFMLTCCAPLIPVLRLGYDAADAARRVSNLQQIFAGGTSTVFNGAKLKDAQAEVDGLTHDLYEIDGAMNVAGAPLAAISPQMRNYRLLVRIGFDLTASADEGLQVAQTLLTPLQGGALSSNSPGLSPGDIAQARAVLADASVRIQDALAAYRQLDVSALPAQLQPGTRYGKMLGLLPEAQGAVGEMQSLLQFVPAMLGIGTPASYLVVAMDRSELRPGGGFQGNYGFLVLDGGKQSKALPLKLYDTYSLDSTYYSKFVQDQTNCATTGPQPPLYYWWWPYRDDPACRYGWGLRDSNLSADFPTNAETAMRIALDAGQVPPNTSLQGEVAFTPVLIEKLLEFTGPITLPGYNNTVTADNVEHNIHEQQLGGGSSGGTERKQFTHDLATALLDKIKSLHGSALKPVLQIAQDAIKQKDLQIYFSDPRAELVLQQLGLGSTVNRSAADGFYVVDTNYGGNKANLFVAEHQTDYVTLLPDGGALHQLQISVNYAKAGSVYNETVKQEDYMDMQRTYMPGDATILGYSGFFPPGIFWPSGCSSGAGQSVAAPITDCSDGYNTFAFKHPLTTSDVAGRTMVMGSLMVACGDAMPVTDTVETYQDFVTWANNGGPGGGNLPGDYPRCDKNPIARTQNIYIEWYTPHAYTVGASGHGTYSELIEKQPGSSDYTIRPVHPGDYLTVYVDASHIHGGGVDVNNAAITMDSQFASLIHGKKPVFNDKLLTDETVTFNF